jgi:Tol biopolymer transport system component
MKKYTRRQTLVLLAPLALGLQGCLNFGDTTNNNSDKFKTMGNVGGKEIGVSDKVAFKGKIYLTLGRNLFVLDDQLELKQLTNNMDVRDPAVSPDGKQIAFVHRQKNYADLLVMPSSGGKTTLLLSGNGKYIPNIPPLAPHSSYHWHAQPAWRDNKTLAFVSDLAKLDTHAGAGIDDYVLDPEVFQISMDNLQAAPQLVATAHYGDGGNRDPSFRPGHTNQIIYTHYQYDVTGQHQIGQIELEDPDAIANNPGVYRAGADEFNPAIDLTPATPDLVNMMPAWSPTGDAIAYVRRLNATSMGLYIMSPPTTDVTKNPNDEAVQKLALEPYGKSVQILAAQFVSQPVWSPDGKQIAYYTYAENMFDLWLVTVAKDAKSGQYKKTGTPQQLTHTGGKLDADSRPFWTT